MIDIEDIVDPQLANTFKRLDNEKKQRERRRFMIVCLGSSIAYLLLFIVLHDENNLNVSIWFAVGGIILAIFSFIYIIKNNLF
jgi:hypothetical protein